jgi:hypothetical protein
MNCLECQELVQKRLDGDRLDASEALDRHLSECAVCRELQAGAVCVLEGLKQQPQVKPRPGGARALVAAVIRDRRRRRDKMRRGVFLTVALAASVVLMLLLASQWLPRQEPNPRHPNPDITNQGQPSNPPSESPLVKNAEKPPPRTALTALTERLADATREHAQVVLVGTNLDAMEKLPVSELPMMDPSVREAGQEVTDGVRTVTRNARRAFDFFARELPMPEIADQHN